MLAVNPTGQHHLLARSGPMRHLQRRAVIVIVAKPRLTILTTLVLIGSVVRSANGQEHTHASPGLGTVEFPVSCSQAAGAEFTRGVALLHHMTYPRARDAFEQTARLDPACAMAH